MLIVEIFQSGTKWWNVTTDLRFGISVLPCHRGLYSGTWSDLMLVRWRPLLRALIVCEIVFNFGTYSCCGSQAGIKERKGRLCTLLGNVWPSLFIFSIFVSPEHFSNIIFNLSLLVSLCFSQLKHKLYRLIIFFLTDFSPNFMAKINTFHINISYQKQDDKCCCRSDQSFIL